MFHFFLELSCIFYDPINIGNLISVSSAFSKYSLYFLKFCIHILLNPGLKDFEYYLDSMWNEFNCMVVWTFFDIVLLWDWSKNWLFPVLWPLLSFPNLLAYWGSTLTASSFSIWNSSTGSPSPPLALFVVMLSKAHLTLHSRMSGSRWVAIPLWLSGSLRPFLYIYSMYSCYLFLIFSISVRSLPFPI